MIANDDDYVLSDAVTRHLDRAADDMATSDEIRDQLDVGGQVSGKWGDRKLTEWWESADTQSKRDRRDAHARSAEVHARIAEALLRQRGL